MYIFALLKQTNVELVKFRIMKHKIRTDARQTLADIHFISGSDLSLYEWAEMESKNEPDFFRWLFDEPELDDFQCSDKTAFNEFLNTLKD